MQEHVDRWLAGIGAPSLGSDPGLSSVDELRTVNRSRLLDQLKRARNLVLAWAAARDLPASSLPGDPITLADEAGAGGLLDFEILNDDATLSWLQEGRRWPSDTPLTLTPEGFGLTPAQLDEAVRKEQRERRQRQDARRRITVDGQDMWAEEENFGQLVAAVRSGLTQKFLASSGTASLSELAPHTSRAPGSARPGFSAARSTKLSDTQAIAVGLAGEIAALEWLKYRYEGVDDGAWVSGDRNQVLGDAMGDDTLGYDFIIERKRSSLLFEVKSSAGGAGEFPLSPTEIARARSLKRRETYHVLYVAHALDSDMRRLCLLPNPLDPRSARYFRSVGEGLRYRFQLTRPE